MVPVKTNKPKCVSVEMEPSKPETVHKVHVDITFFLSLSGWSSCSEPAPCALLSRETLFLASAD